MLTLGVKSNLNQITKAFDAMAKKQVPFATSLALNRVAEIARDALKQEVQKVFDRPKPYTINSVFVKRSNKSNLTATIFHSDAVSKYLQPEIEGGPRYLKGFETIQGAGEAMLPARGIRLDQYGGVPRSVIAKLKGKDIFVVTPDDARRTHLKPGIYERIPRKTALGGSMAKRKADRGGKARTHSGAIKALFFFSNKRPTYKKAYDMVGVVNRVVSVEFDRQFISAMDQALSTARITLKP